jgi:hypothetical protein
MRFEVYYWFAGYNRLIKKGHKLNLWTLFFEFTFATSATPRFCKTKSIFEKLCYPLYRCKSALLGKRTQGLFRTLEDFKFRAGLFHLLWSVPVLYRHSSKYRLATGRYSGHWADCPLYRPDSSCKMTTNFGPNFKHENGNFIIFKYHGHLSF